MFTIEQIKAAHSKVKSGADFPAYVQDLITLGVIHYTTYVADGNTEYAGEGNYTVSSGFKYATLPVAATGNNEAFKHYLSIHQQGQINYPTFCRQAGETGVEKWIVDAQAMTCTYYNTTGNIMLTEQIPSV
jgi:uncharacterized protein YbcV (DUF1398 family)